MQKHSALAINSHNFSAKSHPRAEKCRIAVTHSILTTLNTVVTPPDLSRTSRYALSPSSPRGRPVKMRFASNLTLAAA
jgi:hypothetical protein